jgi:16S rRNA processing protein RimM
VAGTPAHLEIARIGKPHGLRGEVHVWPITDRDERFAPGARAQLGDRELVVVRARRQGDHWVVLYEGVEDRTAAVRLNGGVLTAEPLGPLPEGEFWIHELIGCTVRDQHGIDRGVVEAVQENPAHDLLVLDSGALVPITFLRTKDAGAIVVDVPDGLFEEL